MYAVCHTFSLFPTDAKLKKNGCPASASSDGCVSPEVSLPISSDALQELLMNVFALRKREHKYYCETIIPQQVPLAKEPQRVHSLICYTVYLYMNHYKHSLAYQNYTKCTTLKPNKFVLLLF